MAKSSFGKGLALAAIPVTALVCLFALWRLAPGPTYLLAALAFVALLVALWRAGKD